MLDGGRMKAWQILLLGVLFGLIAAGLILLIASPPKGEPILLLPVPTSQPLVVDISGEINQPGIYQLPPGSRLKDAVEISGGITSQADLSTLNLAAPLKDGQKVEIPARKSVNQAAGFSPSAQPISTGSGLININTARVEELEQLPGIGAVKANAIIAYRNEHGRFSAIHEIQNVTGIGSALFEQIQNLICVEN